jgi:hypothetical protein
MLSCHMYHRWMLAIFTIVCIFLVALVPFHWVASEPPNAVQEDLPNSTLIYVSDYFSFLGEDGTGHVAFAFDNNRGRDGEAYQAEHFLVLHDERQGWVKLAGNGLFPNTKRELSKIPDSPFFRFHGTPQAGLTITSDVNHLTFQIDPIPERRKHRHNGAATWMGSAPAVLTWNQRTIPGRVIYEYLMLPEFNRLTRTYWGIWKEFQGFYLLADHSNDVYVHSQLSERIAPLVAKLLGFLAIDGKTESMKDLKVEVLAHDVALGFYRWPTAWRITWTGSKGPQALTISLFDRNGIANWIIGGFSMGIIRGELDDAGTTHPVYGLAELIM